MSRPPDFDELVGEDITPDERERLRRVHELLLAAGPPPELSPEVASPAAEQKNVFPLFPRRRWAAGFALAAAFAAAAFGAGFLFGANNADDQTAPERIIAMSPPDAGAAPAKASLAVFPKDDAGNWPMELTVRNLAALPKGQTYELWLTKKGELAEPCGTFVVHEGTTVVPLNAPYALKQFDGWVVVRTGTTEPVLTT